MIFLAVAFEFDSIDDAAVHIVMFDEDGTPAATCRVFWDDGMKRWDPMLS